MEKIKLLALDMDGTTLRNDKTISQANLNAIANAVNDDILIVPASGRSIKQLPAEIFDFPIKYAITNNGSTIYEIEDGQYHKVYSSLIPWETAYKITSFLETTTAVFRVTIDDQIYMSKGNFEKDTNFLKNKRVDEELLDISAYIKEHQADVLKIGMAIYDPEEMYRILDLQRDYLELNIMKTGDGYIEMNTRESSKGNALKWLSGKLGITKENIAAIGDSDNDLIMLCYAGYSFAMTNGTRFARETANEITLSNEEDGVAFAIDKILYRNSQID